MEVPIWRYDIATGRWDQPIPNGNPVQRINEGTSVETNLGKALYVGGIKSPFGDAGFEAQDDATQYLVQGLLTFDEIDQTFHNTSTAGMNKFGTAVNAFAVFISSFGQQGILISFGGFATDAGFPITSDRWTDSNMRWQMQNISIYDMANQHWYQQQASGDVPSWRHSGCTILVSAQDQTSHSIYVYGGWGQTNARENDGNVYVLSIPSFVWIRVTNDTDQRSRHQCHLMGNNHMLVVGGNQPADVRQAPSGILGCDITPKFDQGLGIFSLNDHTWTTNYDPRNSSAPYSVHPTIFSVIGGNATGGATKRSPENDFSSDALRSLLSVSDQDTNATSQSSPASGVTSTGSPPLDKTKEHQPLSEAVVIGIVVSSVVGVTILIVMIVFYILYRRRRHRRQVSLNASLLAEAASGTTLPSRPAEMAAAPIEQEFPASPQEESLARTYYRQELHGMAEIHEMPSYSEFHEMPSIRDTHKTTLSAQVRLPSPAHGIDKIQQVRHLRLRKE
ncbi:MAG: hypothetical protein Q9220_001229 [cf. Caloplaca sp. 1 TL-2023]